MHWPELHALFGGENNRTAEHMHQNVISNLHITDWFLTWRLENFIKFWLYNSLDAEWHWYRFEYQARGDIHGHRVAKLENDPGLCTLFEKALKGYLAEMPVNNADPADIRTKSTELWWYKSIRDCLLVCELVGIHIPSKPFRQWYLEKTVNSSLSETSQWHKEYW